MNLSEEFGYLQTNTSIQEATTSSFTSTDVFKRSKESVQITEHGTEYFSKIRKYFHISTELILDSVHPMKNQENLFKVGGGEGGRSGSFFFFTYNRKFLIKTISPGELKLFSKLLPGYTNRLLEGSLISRILGVFSIKLAGIVAIHIILMENSLPTFPHYVMIIYIYIYYIILYYII